MADIPDKDFNEDMNDKFIDIIQGNDWNFPLIIEDKTPDIFATEFLVLPIPTEVFIFWQTLLDTDEGENGNYPYDQ